MPSSVELRQDVDLSELAKRFKFTGGLIKNSIFLALTRAPSNGRGGRVVGRQQLLDAALMQGDSMNSLDWLYRTGDPITTLAELALSRKQKDVIAGMARICQKLAEKGKGFNVLITCDDIPTGVNAVHALAAECNMKVRSYDYDKVCMVRDDCKVIDPVTQKKVTPMQFAFATTVSDSLLTLFVDHSGQLARLLDEGQDKDEPYMYLEMLARMRSHQGLFCLVTKHVRTERIPLEFHLRHDLSYPAADTQLRYWEMLLGKGEGSDGLVRLVEQFPMHINEIDFFFRRASILATVRGADKPSLDDILELIYRYRPRKRAPFIFGGEL
jgi:hypothetical protein